MRESKGVRFGENGFEWNVNMQQNRLATLKDRTAGFEGMDYKQLQAELNTRPEMEPARRAGDQMLREMGDDPETAAKEYAAKMDQTNALLSDLVTAMKQNVTQTSRVAMNTN
jgi:hypothetical protein